MDKTYEIPESNLPKLELQISALARKAVKLGLPEPTLSIEGERMVEIRDNLGTTGNYRKVFDVTVTGDSPKIEGWELIAIIKHLPDGNVINKLPSHRDVVLPDHYRTIDPVCEHCQLERRRKLTYLIRKETSQLMTVGSDCLEDFTGHKSPDALARWYTVLENTMRDAEGFEMSKVMASPFRSAYLTALNKALEIIIKTEHDIIDAEGMLHPATENNLNEIVEAIRELYPETIGIYLVGSVAREETRPDSDIDILILFSDDQDQRQMARRDQLLWNEFPTLYGRNVDFIIRTENGPTVGQFRHRERLGLPNPMTPLWEAKQ